MISMFDFFHASEMKETHITLKNKYNKTFKSDSAMIFLLIILR